MEKRILKITNTIPKLSILKKTRVAAYARVSTDKDEQQNSLQAQKDYFTMLIKSNVTWEFVGIYYDDGISGLTHKNRYGFNNMVEDALGGKIDLIITKSISRFARNTLDSLEVLRKLKDKGVGVYFQKENINTLDGKGEFVLTLMSSFAQEESRSMSENIKWGKRKSFAKGKVNIPFTHFLGYEKGKNGELLINKKEARIVEFIYYLAVLDYSPSQIVEKLENHNIHSPMGNKKWHTSIVRNILSNEKYKGDALLQKSFTVNYLTREKKTNEGELPMYFVENSHEPIISRSVEKYIEDIYFNNLPNDTNRPLGLSEKIFCKECGAKFGSFNIHSECNGGKIGWRCRNKYSKTNKCDIRHVYQEYVYKAINKALLGLLEVREDIKLNVLNMLEITTSPKITKYDESQLINDDIDSIISKILIDKDHDAAIEFIDGTIVNSHVYGTALKAGQRVRKQNRTY